MTSAKYFDAISLVVTRNHSWSLVVTRGLLVVTRGHSWSFVVTRTRSRVLLDTIGYDISPRHKHSNLPDC